MSVPPDQPMAPVPPEQPVPRGVNLKSKKVQGAIVATAAVLVSSALVAVSGAGAIGLMAGTVVALLCVILGSILTIFERTRLFAVGFLIASAILIFVTAGVCTFAFRLGAGMA